jgi:hypothetical protein
MKFDEIIPGLKLEFFRTKRDKRKDEDSPWTMQHGIGTVISKGPFLFTLQDKCGRKVNITRNEIITREMQVKDFHTHEPVTDNKQYDHKYVPVGHRWGEVKA